MIGDLFTCPTSLGRSPGGRGSIRVIKIIRNCSAVALFILLLIGTVPAAVAEAAAPTTGLVGYWAFEEQSGTVAGDSSGQSNNGTLVNGPTWVGGKVGSGALSFDNTNDYVTMGTVSALNLTGAVTVTAWLNVTSGLATNDCIVCRVAGGHTAGTEQYSLYTGLSANQARFQVSNGSVLLNSNTASTAIQPGTWYHLVGIYNGTDTTSLYVNGALVDSDTSPGFGALASPAGARFGVSEQYQLGGLIDEVRVYNRALSASEVTDWSNKRGTRQIDKDNDNNNQYFIVSEGQKRRFADLSQLQALGYREENVIVGSLAGYEQGSGVE